MNPRAWCIATVVANLCLAFGCGGGSGSSDSSSISSGQAPDPVVVDYPIAYVQRPLLTDDEGNLLTTGVRRPIDFFPGAQLILKDNSSPSAASRVLTDGIFPDDEDGNPPQYDVKDPSVSFDGTQLAFAMRAPEDPDLDEDEQPTWNIWIFDAASGDLFRAITSDIVAEDGDDVAPAFLPDGRIVFASTRQRYAKAVLLDEGKPQFSPLDEDSNQPALALHVMAVDGSEIAQVTYNASSDLDPAVMGDGRLVFARWDNVAGNDRISLYRSNPDGTELELLYGVHSHDTGPNGASVEFVNPAERLDGRMLVALRPGGQQQRTSALPVAIDVANYVEHDQPTYASAGLLADAQEVLISGELLLDEGQPSLAGRYAYIALLYDGSERLLVSWSQCRLVDTTSDPLDPLIVPCTDEHLANPDMEEADPLYGVWIHDLIEDSQQPVVVGEEGLAYADVVVMRDRASPPVILDKTAGIDLDPDLVGEAVGMLHIRSVYDFDGLAVQDIPTLRDPLQTTAAQRPARFLRVVKSVAIPDDDLVDLDGTAFGRSAGQLMREIIGYAPIEPDGSVKVKVPANVAFWVDVLDAEGRRITPRHNNWMQLRPGEEMQCNGCHTPDSELPHGRRDAQAPSVNDGAPMDGSPFVNTEPALFANQGETMAELITRVNGVPYPAVDIRFDDLWTDPNVRAKDPSFAYAYADLSTLPPVDPSCVNNWQAACRIAIHYPTHIHPLWSVDRREFAADGVTLIADHTCIACHSTTDALGGSMLPAADLDLSDGVSAAEPAHLNSYRELLFADIEDEEGILSVGGALASPRFFGTFNGGTHAGRLSPAELKLMAEWIDVGGQYYNDPFMVPQ